MGKEGEMESSLLTQELQREINEDRLRMAGYRTRVERRRRDRQARARRAVGNSLIAAGERLRGCTQSQPSATPHLRRV